MAQSQNSLQYKWPYAIENVSNIPPPSPTWANISRITAAECVPSCHDHWPEVTAYLDLKQKESALQHNLAEIQNQLKHILEQKDSDKVLSVTEEDFKACCPSRVSYHDLYKTSTGKDIDCMVTRSLKDPTTFVVNPHPLPETGHPRPVSFALGSNKSSKMVAASEYQDTVSKKGWEIYKSSQGFLHPYPVYTRAVLRHNISRNP